MDQRIFKHESKFLIDFLSLSYLTLMEQSICLDDDTKKKERKKGNRKKWKKCKRNQSPFPTPRQGLWIIDYNATGTGLRIDFKVVVLNLALRTLDFLLPWDFSVRNSSSHLIDCTGFTGISGNDFSENLPFNRHKGLFLYLLAYQCLISAISFFFF